MSLNIETVHTHSLYGFRFVQVKGYGGYDHASAWTFQDEQVVRDRWWHPKAGEVVLDIGAAFGSYALPALAMGARVVCFSPQDLDTQLLNANLELNPELARRCLVVRDGLYSRDGHFDCDRCSFVGAESYDISHPSGQQWIRVRSLDSFLASRPGIDSINWMKLDVEGAELEVFKGAEQCLRRHRPKILVELHRQHIPTIEQDVFNYLTGLGVGYVGEGPIVHAPGSVVTHALFSVPR